MTHDTYTPPSLHPCGVHELSPPSCPSCALEAQIDRLKARCQELAGAVVRAERERDEARSTLGLHKEILDDERRDGWVRMRKAALDEVIRQRDEALARLAKALPATNGRANLEGL